MPPVDPPLTLNLQVRREPRKQIPAGYFRFTFSKLFSAKPICRMLLEQVDFRAAFTAGRSNAMSIATITTTTSSSTNVSLRRQEAFYNGLDLIGDTISLLVL